MAVLKASYYWFGSLNKMCQNHSYRSGAWCNGSTAGFESVNPGSNPGAPATLRRDLSTQEDSIPDRNSTSQAFGNVKCPARDFIFKLLHCPQVGERQGELKETK